MKARQQAVLCSASNCNELATYKVAAAWSDGQFSELKTYGHCCHAHLREVFQDALERRDDSSVIPGETLDEIGIYRFEPGKRDRHLQRLWGLEENYRT
jgi:hypothetical protein